MANVFSRDGLTISAGCVYAENYRGWVATANGGIVVEFNPELTISNEDKNRVSAFVSEANAAPEK